MKTKRDLEFTRPYSALPKEAAIVRVKAGAAVEKRYGVYYVVPSYFPKGSMEEHDATHRGFEVHKDDILKETV